MEAPRTAAKLGGIDAEMGPVDLGGGRWESFEAAELADNVELDGPARRIGPALGSFETPTTWTWG